MIYDESDKVVFTKGVKSILDRNKAVKSGSNYEIEDEVRMEWRGEEKNGLFVADGRYRVEAYGVLIEIQNGTKKELAESEKRIGYVEKVSNVVEISGVKPVDGEVILYRTSTDMVVSVRGERCNVSVNGYGGISIGDRKYLIRGIPLKKGINEMKIDADCADGRVSKVVRYESLQIVDGGAIKREEGGIVIGGRDRDVELRVRAMSMSRDGVISIKEYGAVANPGGIMVRGGIEIDTGGATFDPEAEIIVSGNKGLAEASGGEITDMVVMKEGESEVYGEYLGDNKVYGRIKGGGKYLIQLKTQSNMAIRGAIGMGSIVPEGEEIEGRVSKLPSGIISMKRDEKGNLYILSGDKIYRYNSVSEGIKRLIDISSLENSYGLPMSMAVSGDGSRIYVAHGLGYIVRFDIDENGVGKASKVNGTDGSEEPADGVKVRKIVFLAPRGVEILGEDGDGNVELLVVDSLKREIYRVTDSDDGKVYRVAGAGWTGGVDTDDPIDAKNIRLDIPTTSEMVIVNDRKVLFFADRLGHRVRAMNLNSHPVKMYGYELPAGYIMTVAGKKCNLPTFLKFFCGGYSGDGGLGRDALLKYPSAVSYDRDKELLYIVDSGNKVIRVLTKDGYITTIGGGGDKGGDGIIAREMSLGNPDQVVFLKNQISTEIEIDGKKINLPLDRESVFFSDDSKVYTSLNIISVYLLDENGSIVKNGSVSWDDKEKRYKGSKITLAATNWSGFSFPKIRQVICKEQISSIYNDLYIGGVFDSNRGCNKFGGDYISSMKVEDCDEQDCFERSNYISFDKYYFSLLSTKRNHPGNLRFEAIGGVYRKMIDVSWVLDKGAFDVEPGIQIGSTIYTAMLSDTSNNNELIKDGMEEKIVNDLGKVCAIQNKANATVDHCNISTWAISRDPHKIISNFPYYETECWYHPAVNSNMDIKVCLDRRCHLGPDYQYICDVERRESLINPSSGNEEDNVSNAYFYEERLTRKLIKHFVSKFMDRMKERGLSSVQITYEGVLFRTCKNLSLEKVIKIDDKDVSYPVIVCNDANIGIYGSPKYVIVSGGGFTPPFEVRDMIVNEILEQNKKRKIIKNIFLKPSLWNFRKIVAGIKDDNTQIPPINETDSIGPFSKEGQMRMSDSNRWRFLIEPEPLPLWEAEHWAEVLLSEKDKRISINDKDNIENLDTGFFIGDINTCAPEVELVKYGSGDQIYYAPKIKLTNGNHVRCTITSDIPGTDCDKQEEKGIYNYYCFLKRAVDMGKRIRESNPNLDVYISLSNDHVFPNVVMPYVKLGDKGILELLKDSCTDCKFTNAMVANHVKWNDSYLSFFDSSNTYKTLLTTYLNAPVFKYKEGEIEKTMSLGVNAYANGSCVYDVNNDWKHAIELYNHYCSNFCEGDSNSYINLISNKYDKYYYKVYMGDKINNIPSVQLFGRIYSKVMGVCPDKPVNYDRESLSVRDDCKILCDNKNNLDPNSNTNINICSYEFGDIICPQNTYECYGFNTIDPPIFGSSQGCSGIYECKRDQYRDWLSDVAGKYPLFLSEIGSKSSEFSASGNGGDVPSQFGWSEAEKRGTALYGITNIKDYQEQVDMIEGDIAVFLDNSELRGGNKLKGLIIFSDNLVPEYSDLVYYDFAVTKKPVEQLIKLISGKGTR